MKRMITMASICALCACTVPIPANAQTYWQHEPATPGGWSVPDNWTAGLPTSGVDAWIDNGGTAIISSGSAASQNLYLGGDWGTTGTVQQSGGTASIASDLYLGQYTGSTGTYELSGTGDLNASSSIIVGNEGTGIFTQSAGSAATGGLTLGSAENSEGTYTLQGGTLTTGWTQVGSDGVGTFHHTAGTHQSGGLEVSTMGGSGEYNLGGTGNLLSSGCNVGSIGTGTFNQTGGAHSIDGELNIGGYMQEDGTGAYNLGGGTLGFANPWSETWVHSTGTYTQTGGTYTGSLLSLESNPEEQIGATFQLMDGVFSLDNEEGGMGTLAVRPHVTFVQSGGTCTLDGFNLWVGDFDYWPPTTPWSATATCTISGGQLNLERYYSEMDMRWIGGEIIIGGVGMEYDLTATLECSGGTVRASRLLVGPDHDPTMAYDPWHGQGVLSMSGGQVVITAPLEGYDPQAGGDPPYFLGAVLVGNNGRIEGHGSLTAMNGDIEVWQDGEVSASGGTLILDGNVVGHGSFDVLGEASLYASGQISGPVANAGTLAAYGGVLRVGGNSLVNTGTLAARPGASLLIHGAALSHTGSILVESGGLVDIDQPIVNPSGQSVTLHGGSLSLPELTNADGGTVTGFGTITGELVNQDGGTIDFFGASQIVGDVHNQSGALLGIRNGDLLIVGDTLNDGTIKAFNGQVFFEGDLTNNGQLNIDPAVAVVVGDLIVTPAGAVIADAGSTLKLLANFDNGSVQSGSFDLAAAAVEFNGTYAAGQFQQLEAAGQDVGPDPAGWQDNFAFGALTVGADAKVRLVDARDNQSGSEAVYVGDLGFDVGGTIDPNGLNLYYLNGGPAKQFFIGDASLDGRVDGGDYTLWADSYGQPGAWGDGNFNGDGIVDGGDYTLWADNYGSTGLAAGGAGAAAVPEPVSAGLLLLGLCGLIIRRRR